MIGRYKNNFFFLVLLNLKFFFSSIVFIIFLYDLMEAAQFFVSTFKDMNIRNKMNWNDTGILENFFFFFFFFIVFMRQWKYTRRLSDNNWARIANRSATLKRETNWNRPIQLYVKYMYICIFMNIHIIFCTHSYL